MSYKAFSWAKKNKKFKWLKQDTMYKDLTTTKKAIMKKAYEKSLEKKKTKAKAPEPNIKGKEIKETTGQKNLQSLLGLGDLASMITEQKTKVNEKRRQKLEEESHSDLEEASSRANKEQYGTRLRHHDNTSTNTLINFIFKKGLNVEKHLKDIKREDKEKEEKRQKEYEAGVAKMEKQAKRGTLPFKAFYEYLQDDNGFQIEHEGRLENVIESYSWGADFYRIVKRVTKRDVDSFNELTDAQQDKFHDIVLREADKEHMAYLKTVYEEVIKKKKFNSLKDAVDRFMKKYKSI